VSAAVTGLGNSPQLIKRLAFGCEQFGGYEWGVVDPGEVAAAIEIAIERGVNLFDTADCYGRGESERRLGRVLAPHRERVVLATKFGVRFTDSGSVWYDSSPEWATQALAESLARLGTDVIDLFQMHYWDGTTSLVALFERLERLREQHKIRWYGITNLPPGALVPAGYPGFVSASLEYSLIERTHEAAARQFADAGLTFLAYGSLAQGMLSGKYRAGARFTAGDRRSRLSYRNFHGSRLERNSALVEVVRRQGQQLGATASQVAIAWVLQAIRGSVPLVGIKRPDQLLDVLGGLQLELPAEVVATLDLASAAPGVAHGAARP
jgi:aryl-alcohol dehydrogenase-like predicted oxidoreductase